VNIARKHTGRQQIQRQRRQLWEHDPHCHWCGCLTVLIEGRGSHEKEYPPNMATLGHLDSRLSENRGKRSGEYRRVLACHRCNNARSRAEMKATLPQTLWERNNQFRKIAKLSGALNEV